MGNVQEKSTDVLQSVVGFSDDLKRQLMHDRDRQVWYKPSTWYWLPTTDDENYQCKSWWKRFLFAVSGPLSSWACAALGGLFLYYVMMPCFWKVVQAQIPNNLPHVKALVVA